MALNSKKRPVESSSEAEDSSSSEEALQQEPQPTLQPPQQPQNVDEEDDDEEEESDDPEKADTKKPQSESELEEEEKSNDPEKADAMKPQSESESEEEEEEESDDPEKAEAKKPQSESESEEEEEESEDPEKADDMVTPRSKKPQSESESEEDDAVKNKSPAILTKRALENPESSKNNKKAKVTPSSKKPQSESEEEDDEESDSPEPVTLPTKRALENAESSKNNKKAKVSDGKIGGSAVDDSKKSAINRVWSEKDEILLLEELHSFMTKNGRDSITNLNAFHQTLKDLDLSLDVTKSRLYEKIRGLRNKYLKNVTREQTVFPKPHEEKLYKISEKIWGGGVDVFEKSDLRKSKRDKKVVKKSVEKDICKMEEANDVKKDAGSSFPRLVASLESQASKYFPMMVVDPKEFANNMVLKFGKKIAKELEEDWKEYGLMEAKIYATRVKIMSEQFNVFLDVLKHSNLN